MSDAETAPTDLDARGGTMLGRVRRLVSELESLSSGRGEDAARLVRERDGGDRSATATRDEQAEAIENRRLAAVARAQETYAERERTILEDLDRREASIRQRHADARTNLNDKAETNDQEASKQLQETVWLAETVYEASEDKPADRERVTIVGVEGRRGQIDDAIDRTLARLRRSGFRAQMPASGEPDAALAAGAIDAEATPNPEAADAPAPPAPDERSAAEARGYLEQVADAATQIAESTEAWRSVRIFGLRMLPAVLILLTVAGGAGGWALASAGTVAAAVNDAAMAGAGIGLVLPGALGLAGHLLVRRSAHRRLAELAIARRAADGAAVTLRHEAGRIRRGEEFALIVTRDRDVAAARTKWEPIIVQIGERLARKLTEIDETAAASLERVTTARRELIGEETRRRDERLETAEREAAETTRELLAETAGDASSRHARFGIGWDQLLTRWNDGIAACERERAALDADARRLFPDWDHPSWNGWTPPHDFAPAARLARVQIDRREIPGSLPDQPDFQDPMPATFELPVTLDFPEHCSLLVSCGHAGREAGLRTIQGAMMRLLTATPPGKLQFTIFDPVGLGESFAGFMHLGDYDESFVGGRIWTETRHIEQRLTDLTEHMEHVIQKYLRNAYDSIADYNEAAGEIAEPYRFLVIADFPSAFNEASAARLASILSSGPRCGVFTLILADQRRGLPPGLDQEALDSAAVILREHEGQLVLDDRVLGRWPIEPEAPPAEELATRLLHDVGAASKDARRVEVPFDVISPPEGELWSRSSERELVVPLGKCGATRLQELVIGPGTSQHALIAGKTGSGKSTLMHVLVTNLAQWYSPDEVRFYLVDFKKGVEFKTYATQDLPHALAVAVESDREFGLSVLERIDEELRQRGEQFRAEGVQDIPGWRRARPDVPMPRILLMIDEFQELFVEDDKLGQDAALLMDRIVRQGRAFGVHVILGSQTLGGSYSLPRSTLGQMQVRIALQCSESDAYLIMSDDNAAARLLTRPGEAIYNDAGGRIEGNSPFQIVWLPESVRERRLAAVRERAEREGFRRDDPLMVFEGNVPADLQRNLRLGGMVSGERAGPAVPVAWLGEAIAIKGPTEAVFQRRSGSNLLIVGQRDEAAASMMLAAGLAIVAGQGGASSAVARGPGAVSGGGGTEPALPDSDPNATPASPGDVAERENADLGFAASLLNFRRPAKKPVDDPLEFPADEEPAAAKEPEPADITPPADAPEPAPAAGVLPDSAPMLVVLDGTPPDTPLSGMLHDGLADLRVPAVFPSYRRTDEALVAVTEILRDRATRDATGEPPVILMVHGLQRFRNLRPSDEFGFSSSHDDAPAAPKADKLFAEILEDGPSVGVHVIAWCDTVTNLMRTLPRQGLREFDMRVAFQLGGADSTQFIDAPDAATLGLQRALFFSEEAGRLEKFRPYARPDADWLERTRRALTD